MAAAEANDSRSASDERIPACADLDRVDPGDATTVRSGPFSDVAGFVLVVSPTKGPGFTPQKACSISSLIVNGIGLHLDSVVNSYADDMASERGYSD